MKKIKLGDIAEIVTGPFGSQLHACDYTTNGIPYIMPKDIGERFIIEDNISRISTSDAKRLRRYQLSLGDIIYSRRGDIEKCALIKPENVGALCGTGCIRVRPNSIKVMPLFLSLYLGQPHVRKWIVSHAVGATMPNLNSDILKQLPIKLPSIAEQNKIAAILDALDAKIALNKKINATLESMAKTLYMHEFFRKLPNGKLNDIIIENSKSIIPVGAAKSTGGKFPFFTSGDSVLSWTDSLVDGRNIFLNDGGNAGVKFYVGKAAYSTHTYNISAKENLADYIYLLLKVIEPELDKRFFTGTGLKNLRKDLLKEREIYIPTKTEREQFNAIVQPCFTKISANFRESRRLAEMRDWLLPMLMNGQIQFKET